MRALSVLWCLLPVLVTTDLGAQPRFEAGVARVDLELPEGLTMWGYTPRQNRGELDPLMARVFTFRVGDEAVALVTLDLGRTPAEPQMARVRSMVKEAGIDDVLFHASHTHSGPYLRDRYEDGVPDWELAFLDRIADAIIVADRDRFEARLGVGRGRVEIGHNRRLVLHDGTVRMLWANPTRVSTFPLDPEVLVLRIDDLAGNVRGILAGYACHPVIFGPDNLLYSADFPGAMSRRVRELLPGDPVVAFAQGGAGDINPFLDKRELAEAAVASMEAAGSALGEEVARVADTVNTEVPAAPGIQLQLDRFELEHRPQSGSLSGRALATEASAVLTVLLLNGEIAFVGLPGEPFVEFQLDLKRRRLADASFFLGYTNGYVRYFPTIRAIAEGGYGAEPGVAVVEPGAGERMMMRAYRRLLEMTGKLRPEPGG